MCLQYGAGEGSLLNNYNWILEPEATGSDSTRDDWERKILAARKSR